MPHIKRLTYHVFLSNTCSLSCSQFRGEHNERKLAMRRKSWKHDINKGINHWDIKAGQKVNFLLGCSAIGSYRKALLFHRWKKSFHVLRPPLPSKTPCVNDYHKSYQKLERINKSLFALATLWLAHVVMCRGGGAMRIIRRRKKKLNFSFNFRYDEKLLLYLRAIMDFFWKVEKFMIAN